MDRWVRDVLAWRAGDAVLHVAPNQWVFESADHRFVPMAVPSEDAGLAALGRPSWVHVHAMTTPVMEAARRLSEALGCPLGITLHDVCFAEPGPDADTRADLVLRARWVLAPSDYLAGVARDWIARVCSGQDAPMVQVLPNGWRPWPETPAVPATGQGEFAIGMVGALGLHKGLAFAREMAACLPPRMRVVLIGYADGQLTPGWLIPDRLWVHGAFETGALPSLLRAYGVQVVWFAPGQPESFCYALSDVWQAGWPAVVPDAGALGERMQRVGFGCVYDPYLSPQRVAALLQDWLLHPRCLPHAEQPVEREVTVAEMVRQLEMVYGSDSVNESFPPDDAALQHLAQTHLDSRFFRHELLRLQGELEAAQAQTARLRVELDDVARAYEARGRWIEKLQSDIDALNVSIAVLQERNGSGRWWGAIRRWVDQMFGR
ncbi:hypothetical protein A9O67_11375 [Tepidimonas fonticaldi]|uniref:Glycosyltransferase subfamily 4-like N-terminal domain-containing protein n=2 Tax=Tepidimonas fonticaldi TaxID=1101373 RepID=A0A1A6DY76_9BURK|nr:hypothetical protein A9O67_11375 [Tepidimonas fonticaldi]